MTKTDAQIQKDVDTRKRTRREVIIKRLHKLTSTLTVAKVTPAMIHTVTPLRALMAEYRKELVSLTHELQSSGD